MNLVYLLFALLAGRATAGVISETRPSGPRKYLLGITGNETLLKDDLDGVLRQALLLRNNSSCQFGLKWFKGAHGAVASIEFIDKTRWAVKLSENSEYYRFSIARALDSVSLIKEFCPDIPVPQIRSQMYYTRSRSLVYYFMDWVDGIPLYSFETVLRPGNDTWKSRDIQDVVSLPATTINQLAAFVYNLTTCPIPREKAAQSYASCLNLSLDLAERALEHPIAALKARIINSTGLLLSSPEDILAPLEKILTLAWSSKELRSSKYDPFVLSHWDLRPPNILIDPHHNIKGIVDWESVYVRPLPQAAVSLEHALFPFWDGRSLDEAQAELFHQEFERLEWEGRRSQNLSASLRKSMRNYFLQRLIADPPAICADSMGNRYFGQFMENACRLSPENLEAATYEWRNFINVFFFRFERPVPDWPQYIQIQRRLGRLDLWDHGTKTLRRQVRQQLRLVFTHLSQKYPRWKWAVKMKCFFTAAASDKYKFRSGEYGCL